MMDNEEVKPFELNVDSSEIEDLRVRLRAARWPEKETVDDWSQFLFLHFLSLEDALIDLNSFEILGSKDYLGYLLTLYLIL